MIKINTKSSLKKEGFLLASFLILSVCFTYENAISQKKWNRDYITIDYSQLAVDRSILIKYQIIDYEFGAFGELGHLHFICFSFSTDGLTFTPLMKSHVFDQSKGTVTFLYVKSKLANAKIEFIDTKNPASGSFPDISSFKEVTVDNLLYKAYFSFKWYVDANLDVQEIMVSGYWFEKGLKCKYKINDEIYKKEKKSDLNTNVQTYSKQNYANIAATDHLDNNQVKVYKESDAVAIRGALIGENIKVYNVSGTVLKSIVTKNETVKIKLPENQIYIIQVGQTRYKVAM